MVRFPMPSGRVSVVSLEVMSSSRVSTVCCCRLGDDEDEQKPAWIREKDGLVSVFAAGPLSGVCCHSNLGGDILATSRATVRSTIEAENTNTAPWYRTNLQRRHYAMAFTTTRQFPQQQRRFSSKLGEVQVQTKCECRKSLTFQVM